MINTLFQLLLLLLSALFFFTSYNDVVVFAFRNSPYSSSTRPLFRVSTRNIPSSISFTTTTTTSIFASNKNNNNNNNGGKQTSNSELIDDKNWIEKVESFTLFSNSKKKDDSSIQEYNIGISGIVFETGTLSSRMYEAITMQREEEDDDSDEIMKRAYKIYALDYTAKEATKLACQQNGYDTVFESEDISEWGRIEEIQFIDAKGRSIGPSYNSWEDAVDKWRPGKSFNFVVNGIKAKQKELVLDEVLQSLDPDGSLREQAGDGKFDLPTEEIRSLRDLSYEIKRRCEEPSEETASDDNDVFAGTSNKGYNIISSSDLLLTSTNPDGSETHKTLMHVMDALVSHNVLLVDLAADGNYENVIKMAKMWEAAEKFFSVLDTDPKKEKLLPRMTSIDDIAASENMGYATFEGMQFLETRLHRQNGTVLPAKVGTILEEMNLDSSALGDAFRVLADVGKNVVRIATAASSVENGGFDSANNNDNAEILATQCATRMAEELVDDGTFIDESVITEGQQQTSISMSPHRLCQYSHPKKETPLELFGAAHTDSSFVTIVPVGAISGLEVYDEDAQQWYHPELKARNVWEQQQRQMEKKNNNNEVSNLFLEEITTTEEEKTTIPWHARYVAILPGEFLQIVSRNEIAAAVHRFVVADDASRIIAAPLLLRGRSGVTLNAEKYVGKINDENDNLLKEVNGVMMQDIHTAIMTKKK